MDLGDLRMSALALGVLTENDEIIALGLHQIATSYLYQSKTSSSDTSSSSSTSVSTPDSGSQHDSTTKGTEPKNVKSSLQVPMVMGAWPVKSPQYLG